MSAVLRQAPQLAPMQAADLDAVLAIEQAVYAHPWTRGNFADSLRADYRCCTWRLEGELVGYFVVLCAAREAHLLNLSIAPAWQRRGHGSAVLREAMRVSRESGARQMFLEVRPSNRAGQALYERFEFKRLGVRRGYYPARGGREDALVLSCAL